MELKYKKLTMSLLGVAIAFIGRELGIDEKTIQMVITVISSFIVGQGIADFGKEKTKIEIKANGTGQKGT